MDEHERKHLSEVIDYDRDIAPYRVIEVVSGVGSGKNYWVENVLMEKYHVLLITSRKAKVDETKERTGLYRKINAQTIDKLQEGQWGGFENAEDCNIVCNNANIEHYMKNLYSIGHKDKHLWNCFDIIILDEAHSLATDATFTDSPFHVLSFLRAAYRESKAKIILMTATPNPIKDIVPLIYIDNPSLEQSDDIADTTFICHQLTLQCIDVSPQEVVITAYDVAVYNIMNLYETCKKNGKKARVIYFANHRRRILDLMNTLILSGLPKEKIAISFSDKSEPLLNEDGTPAFDEETLQRKRETEQYISQHEDFPEGIYLLITTSRNKEGINIKNKDYQWNMITESHYVEDIKQMWGRARSGLTAMEIVYDAPQFTKLYCRYEHNFLLSKHSCARMNTALKEYMESKADTLVNYELIHQNDSTTNMYYAAKPFIEYIEETMPYVRFDVAEEKFKQYRGRVLGNRDYAHSLDMFEYYCQHYFTTHEVVLDFEPFEQTVYWQVGLEHLAENRHYFRQLRLHERILQFLEDYDFLNVSLDTVKQEIVKDYLFSIGICTANGKRYTSLGAALKDYNFTCRDANHHKNSPKIISEIS